MAIVIKQKTPTPPPSEVDGDGEDVALRDELVIDGRSFDAVSDAIASPPPPTPDLIALFKKRQRE